MHYDPYNIPKNAVPGFTTSAKTRPAAVARLEEDLRLHDFILHSKRTINELETFIFENGKPQAQDNYNDDLIMSLAIGMYVRATTLKIHGNDREYAEAMMNNFGFETQKFDSIVRDDKKDDIYTMRLPNGEKENFKWIF